MIMTPVKSSDIASIGYEGSILYVRFNSGGMYAYPNVPESLYRALMEAPSHGKFFAANIKNRYPFIKM